MVSPSSPSLILPSICSQSKVVLIFSVPLSPIQLPKAVSSPPLQIPSVLETDASVNVFFPLCCLNFHVNQKKKADT